MRPSTLFVGLEYPIYAASMCGFWTVSRIVFTVQYSTGDANKVSGFFETDGL